MNVIMAWKDADYRESLSAEELAAVPAHPSGTVPLDLDDLLPVAGGTASTWPCGIVAVSAAVCTKDSWCGTCQVASSHGCC